MSIIFADAWLITMNERREVLESASVCVEKDRIAALGTRPDLQRRFPEAEVVDCKGCIVMPALCCRHSSGQARAASTALAGSQSAHNHVVQLRARRSL